MKKTMSITLFSILVFLMLIAVSYFFPGKIFIIEDIRLYFQTKIMYHVSPWLLGDFNYNNEGEKIPYENVIILDELEAVYSELETGDIFLTESTQFITAHLIPGQWKHSAIYLGTKEDVNSLFEGNEKALKKILTYYKTGEEKLILDSHRDGVEIRTIEKLSNLTTVSQLKNMIFFRLNIDKEEKIKFLSKSIEYMGKPYDYDLIHNDDAGIYCSELMYFGLKEIDIEVNVMSKSAFRKIISPTDLAIFLNESDKAIPVLYIGAKKNKLVEYKLEKLNFS